MNNIYNKAQELADMLKNSDEFTRFCAARDRITADESTRVLLKDYRTLQCRVQAAMVTGQPDEVSLAKLQKMGELLQLNPDASEYLFAQYRLSNLLGDIYKLLADAVDIDLSVLDE